MALSNLPNLEDILQCSVCMEKFQASGTMKPKMLPCQHSFCMGCLDQLVNRTRIECPLCRKICRTRVDELPNNLILLQLIDSTDPLPPMPPPRSASLGSQFDRIATIRKYCTEPAKLLPELKHYHQGQKAEIYQAEHLSAVLQCLEQYVRHPLKQPDIIIVCVQILGGMIKFVENMSDNEKERLHKNTMFVVMARNIRSAVHAQCINILYSLHHSNYQKSCTCACLKALFEILDQPLQIQDQSKLVIVLLASTWSLKTIEKGEIGDRHNIKRILNIIKRTMFVDAYLTLLLSILTSLTDMAATPCISIVEEGGLDLLQSIIQNSEHGEIVLTTALVLVSNISEVPGLQKDIIKNKVLLGDIVTRLQSKNATTCVLSAKMIAHLALTQASEWQQLCCTYDTRKKALRQLDEQVRAWIKKDPGKLDFNDSTFKPIFPILQMYSAPPCQLYAAWFLRKNCYEDKERCVEILIREDGISVLLDIKENDYADKTLRKVIGDILATISPN